MFGTGKRIVYKLNVKILNRFLSKEELEMYSDCSMFVKLKGNLINPDSEIRVNSK